MVANFCHKSNFLNQPEHGRNVNHFCDSIVFSNKKLFINTFMIFIFRADKILHHNVEVVVIYLCPQEFLEEIIDIDNRDCYFT